MSQTSWKDALIIMANYKYPAELWERATRLAVEARRDPPELMQGFDFGAHELV